MYLFFCSTYTTTAAHRVPIQLWKDTESIIMMIQASACQNIFCSISMIAHGRWNRKKIIWNHPPCFQFAARIVCVIPAPASVTTSWLWLHNAWVNTTSRLKRGDTDPEADGGGCPGCACLWLCQSVYMSTSVPTFLNLLYTSSFQPRFTNVCERDSVRLSKL